ncbi:SURP and G-patch domain-containing protein 1 isoform X1 [Hydra vulgaris]|nr:SURP and G-patch domain-containing protein 1-like isoform X1 [Hydra vulgaris]
MASFQQEKYDHASFLEKKKAEILARKKGDNVVNPLGTAQSQSPNVSFIKSENGITVPFANDGSFLERFKAMQNQPKSSTSNSNSSTSSTMKSIIKTEGQSSSFTTLSKGQYEPSKLAPIFKEEAKECISSEYALAEELAQKVARDGPDAEAKAKIQYQKDPRYSFLYDPTHQVAKFFKAQVKKIMNELCTVPSTAPSNSARKRRWDDSDGNPSPVVTTLPVSQITTSPATSLSQINSESEFEKAKALIRAKAAALLGGAPIIDTEEEKKRAKAIEEQKMMNSIYEKVIQQQVLLAMEASKTRESNKPKYEYDSDEETEGGTWEHKKRHQEMMKTLEWARDLTENAKGKHHLSDFLPPEELEKFLEKVKAVKEGREADFSDYAKYKIQEDNIGFKMLQKAGWKEGEGLGSKGDGIVQPINKGKVSFDQSGIGVEKVHEVQQDDDDFEVYRKRMMLAYKFRPNPLNNPRRPYYS